MPCGVTGFLRKMQIRDITTEHQNTHQARSCGRSSMTAPLPQSPLRTADLLFVLAGRKNRMACGLKLFHQELAPRMLLSIDRFDIRRFSELSLPVPVDLLKLAHDVPPPERHFFVLFESKSVQVRHVLPGRFGTLTEIESLANWLNDYPEIHSLLIISSASHLRRIRMCCQSLLDPRCQIRLIAAPDAFSGQQESESMTAVVVETLKVLLYWIILRLRRAWPGLNYRRERACDRQK